MSAREQALATLSAIASSSEAVAASPAHMLAAIDAVVVVFMTADTSSMTGNEAAVRSPAAAWASVFSHAQNRMRNIKIAKGVAA